MCLAENSLPMMNGEEHERIVFKERSEGVRQALESSAGKVLLLSDDGSLSAFSIFPRTISLIFDGDTLPLFAMPDGVSRVIASGGKEALFAARYFANVRRIPCTLFPQTAALDGVFEPRGEIFLGGERVISSFADGECVCDEGVIAPTLAEGYARLLLTRLAFCEAEALTAFGIPRRGIASELPETAKEIASENARVRLAERAGGYGGEGTILASFLQGDPCPSWRAFLLLSALYAAFFEKGKPRRYLTPDYHARAARAGVETGSVRIPSREEYAARALILERIRARSIREFSGFITKRGEFYAAVSRLSSTPLPEKAGGRAYLDLLPEQAGSGLSAVIRDFGLMEWHDDKGRTSATN